MIVGDLRPPLEQRLHHLLTVEREGQRLAHELVGELALVATHPDLPVRGRLHLEHGEVGVVEQDVAAEHGELDERVDLATLHGGHHRAYFVEELGLLAVEQGRAAPIALVARERRPRRRVVTAEHPRSGAVRRAVERCPGLVVGRGDQRLGVEDRDQVREVAVRAFEVEHRDVGVGGVHRTFRDDPGEASVGGHHQAVHRRRDVGGRERRAVRLPGGALLELERPHGAVLVRLPGCGQARSELAVIAERDQELEGLCSQPVGAEVLHRDRIECGGRCLVGDPQGAPLLAGAGRAGGARRARSTRRARSAGRPGCAGRAGCAGRPRGARARARASRVVVVVAARRDHGADRRDRQAR